MFKYIVYYCQKIISFIRKVVVCLNPDVTIGKNTIIESNVTISTQYGGKIVIGDNCILSSGVQILTHGGDITIGNHTTINPYTVVYGQGGTQIGDNVRIAAHCVIVPSNHIYADPDVPIYRQGLSRKGITIGDDVWLGAGVKVLDGVTIGNGCVVGASSLVNKSLISYSVSVGTPCKMIKMRKI